MKDKIAYRVFEFYLKSRDFNGIPYKKLLEDFSIDESQLNSNLIELVNDNEVAVVFSETNPHIRAFPDLDQGKQIENLGQDKRCICIYPTKKYVEENMDDNLYIFEPYNLELALGAAQLEFRSFDLSILEIYKNDPRYYYKNDDVRGYISIEDAFFEKGNMPEHDQILLETFGFSYDDNMNRAVAVFVRYLSTLSPEHQQIWKSKELKNRHRMHPDYFRNSILGECAERISLSDAFLLELEIINKMCSAMGYPPLFRNDFKDLKPSNFCFLVRPTLSELNSFIHTLDKMLSDNLNKNFFKQDLSLEYDEERSDGKIVVNKKGTISLLDEWFHRFFKPKNGGSALKEAIDVFKNLRKLRQKPAHAFDENVFDQKYFHEQRELFINAYDAVRCLRLVLANHPAVKRSDIEIPDYLFEGKIWEF